MKGVRALLLLSCLQLLSCVSACGRAEIQSVGLARSAWYEDSLAGVWADSVLRTLTLRERIAQSFILSAYSNKNIAYEERLREEVQRYGVGGVIFFQGTAARQARLINGLQAVSKVPLLVAMDAEWGLGMRLEDAIEYPRAMAYGATGEPRYAYRLGMDLAMQMRRLGVHVNFAPVVDINVDGDNPVIGVRAYGDEEVTVEAFARAYALGLEQHGVMACLKHFPGHGNTRVDSHKGLPRLAASLKELEDVELKPFRALSKEVSMIMLAHMDVPAITGSRTGLPTSLSPMSVNLLRDSFNFKGLICTDALNMQGAVAGKKAWQVNCMAYEAGVDLLLCVEKAEETLDRIEQLVKNGSIDTSSVNERAKRILRAKYSFVSAHPAEVQLNNLYEDLHRPEYSRHTRELAEGGVVLLREGAIPFDSLANRRMGYVSLLSKDSMHEGFREYLDIPRLRLSPRGDVHDAERIARFVKGKTDLVVAVEALGTSPKNGFGLASQISRIRQCARGCPTTVVLFGSPYALRWLDTVKGVEGLVFCGSSLQEFQREAVRVLLGVRRAEGRLPVRVNAALPRGAGNDGRSSGRLSYEAPCRVMIDTIQLAKADSIARGAIDSQAMPGMQILAACDGVVFYSKQFGRFTYDETSPSVSDSTMYDVASLTKVLVTIPLLMNEMSKGTISLNDTLGRFLADDANAVRSARVRDVLLHQAGFVPYVPFYLNTVEPLFPSRPVVQKRMSAEYCVDVGSYGFMSKHVVPSKRFYRAKRDAEYSEALSDGLYASPSLRDSVFHSLYSLGLGEKREYKYSDLGYITLGRVVERVESRPLDALVDSILFRPLGMGRTMYTPAKRGLSAQCAPTENEVTLRKGVVQGYAHDLTAAMLGGVAGHAGLFSTARDLAKYAQMLLNGGEYGGYKFFTPAMVSLFTSVPQESVNGVRTYGFDTRADKRSGGALVGDSLSEQSYGHSGFTGTMLWIDPAKRFLFVLLSNRVYPDASNQRINSLKVRSRIMDALYNAIVGY